MNITINLSPEQQEKLLYITEKSGIDVDTLVNKAIETQYENLQHSEEKSLNILKKSGFIGCGAGDSNLSTNCKTILAQEWSDKYDNS